MLELLEYRNFEKEKLYRISPEESDLIKHLTKEYKEFHKRHKGKCFRCSIGKCGVNIRVEYSASDKFLISEECSYDSRQFWGFLDSNPLFKIIFRSYINYASLSSERKGIHYLYNGFIIKLKRLESKYEVVDLSIDYIGVNSIVCMNEVSNGRVFEILKGDKTELLNNLSNYFTDLHSKEKFKNIILTFYFYKNETIERLTEHSKDKISISAPNRCRKYLKDFNRAYFLEIYETLRPFSDASLDHNTDTLWMRLEYEEDECDMDTVSIKVRWND